MTLRLSRRGTLAFGLLLAAAGVALFAARARFVARSEPVDGVIAYTTRYTLGVQPDGESATVSVRRPFLHLYARGQRVRIRVDREAALPGRLRIGGRVDSFFGLWLLPAFLSGLGGVLVIGSGASGRSRRFRLGASIST